MTPTRVSAWVTSDNPEIVTRASSLLRLRYALIGFTAGLLSGGLLLGALP